MVKPLKLVDKASLYNSVLLKSAYPVPMPLHMHIVYPYYLCMYTGIGRLGEVSNIPNKSTRARCYANNMAKQLPSFIFVDELSMHEMVIKFEVVI